MYLSKEGRTKIFVKYIYVYTNGLSDVGGIHTKSYIVAHVIIQYSHTKPIQQHGITVHRLFPNLQNTSDSELNINATLYDC